MPKSRTTTLGALNIRAFPEDLLWRCKAVAAQNQQTLRQWVIEVLEKAVSAGRKD